MRQSLRWRALARLSRWWKTKGASAPNRPPGRPRGRILLLVCARGPDLVPGLPLVAAFGVPARRYPALAGRLVGEDLGHGVGCGLLGLRRRNGNRGRLGSSDLRRGNRVDRREQVR